MSNIEFTKEEAAYIDKIEIVEPNTPWKFNAKELAKRNSHDVPQEVIEKMIEKWDPNISVEDILKAKIEEWIKENELV